MPADGNIRGDIIMAWRMYTMKFFQSTPSHFLIENEFYQELSSNMKVGLIRDNLLTKFQEKFDTFWNDPEFSFKGDNKMIAMIVTSLRYENCDPQ